MSRNHPSGPSQVHAPAMKNRDPHGKPEHIGNILQSILDQPEMARQSRGHAALQVWESVVGLELSRHCRAKAVVLDQGTMIVEVEHSAWMHYLQMQEEALRERINRAIGHPLIQRIRFRLWDGTDP